MPRNLVEFFEVVRGLKPFFLLITPSVMQIKSRQQAHMDGGMGDTHIEFIFFFVYIHP